MAIAILLGKDDTPVRLAVRHREWQTFPFLLRLLLLIILTLHPPLPAILRPPMLRASSFTPRFSTPRASNSGLSASLLQGAIDVHGAHHIIIGTTNMATKPRSTVEAPWRRRNTAHRFWAIKYLTDICRLTLRPRWQYLRPGLFLWPLMMAFADRSRHTRHSSQHPCPSHCAMMVCRVAD
jgi:hypothetical protein